jgi:integrase
MQNGSVMRGERRRGPDVWEYRWREPGADGKRKHRRMVVGSVHQFRNKTAVIRATSTLHRDINMANVRGKGRPVSLSQLADHYCQSELASSNRWKTHSTKMGYRGYLRKWIIPRRGRYTLSGIRAGEIELWLRSLPLARSTCAKIRNVMSVLFNHGLRHELLDRNPVQWVRQSAKRKTIPAVLEIEEVQSLLRALEFRERTMVLLDVATGLRAS